MTLLHHWRDPVVWQGCGGEIRKIYLKEEKERGGGRQPRENTLTHTSKSARLYYSSERCYQRGKLSGGRQAVSVILKWSQNKKFKKRSLPEAQVLKILLKRIWVPSGSWLPYHPHSGPGFLTAGTFFFFSSLHLQRRAVLGTPINVTSVHKRINSLSQAPYP